MRLLSILPCTILTVLVTLGVWSAPTLHASQVQEESATVTIDLRDAPASELLQSLSQRLKRPVVLDGYFPTKISLHASGSRKVVLDIISRSLDVDVIDGKNGAVLLVRRFNRDLSPPQGQPEQIHALADSVLHLLPRTRPLADQYDWSDDIRTLAKMLTPDQVASLKAGRHLRWSELITQQQQQLAAVLNARIYGGPRYAWGLLYLFSQDPEKTTIKAEGDNDNIWLEIQQPSGVKRMPVGVSLKELSQ